MPSESVPISSAGNAAYSASQSSSLPLWDRLSKWASENRVIVYTIAGVAVVVTGAGVVYYSSGSRNRKGDAISEDKKRVSKKERRKAKKEKEKEQEQSESQSTPRQPKEQGCPPISIKLNLLC